MKKKVKNKKDHKSCSHNTPMLPYRQQIPFINYSNIYFMPT